MSEHTGSTVARRLDIRKGVVAKITPDEDMPTDEFGNRADVVVLSSVVNRMNPGRTHEQLVGAAGRDVIKRIRRSYGLPDIGHVEDEDVRHRVMHPDNHRLGLDNFEYLMGFYKLLHSTTYDKLNRKEVIESNRHLNHLIHVIHDGAEPHGLFLQLRSDSGVKMDEVIAELWNPESPYHPEMSRVTYRDLSGKLVTTKEPVLIGPNYYMALEKTATDGSGVSSSKANHFGVTARLTNADKYTRPGRETVTRPIGESEARNLAHAMGAEVLADNMDLNNNPVVHAEVCKTILTHPTPTNIERVVDRTKYKLGGHRPLQFVRHQLMCSGKDISMD